MNRQFQVSRPNALWVSDPRFHHSGAGPDPRFCGGRLYVATWRGFACTALVIDAYARRIPASAGTGWRVSNSLHTDLALLLKAAELHGATHQAVMEFQVVTDKRLPRIRAGRTSIAFHYRKNMDRVAAGVEDRKVDDRLGLWPNHVLG